MSLEKFIKNFEEAVEDIEPGSLKPVTEFKQLETWDSLAILSATDVIEMEYGVLLSKKSLEGVTTLEDLYQFVLRKQ
jgi:acyl carrier protein